MVETTPCVAFMRLRDRGLPAVCEADIPQTVTSLLLRTLADRPTFINDPVVVPDENKVIAAHCTAPTRMNGYDQSPESYRATLHHETRLGMSPSVQFSQNQTVTMAGFSHDLNRVIATPGTITRNTDYHICVTQVEVDVPDASFLYDQFQGFHWVLVYGDWMGRLRRVARLLEVEFLHPDRDTVPQAPASPGSGFEATKVAGSGCFHREQDQSASELHRILNDS